MHPIHDQHDWNIPGWIRGDPFSNKPKLANGDGSEAMMFLLVVYIYIYMDIHKYPVHVSMLIDVYTKVFVYNVRVCV